MKKIILFTAVILSANLMFAQIINIPDDYPTIQQGINNANAGDTVLVQPGTYFENLTIDALPLQLMLASLFLTTGDTSYISQTIIDGNQEEKVIDIVSYGDRLLTICGFTIQNGHTDYLPSGGGIRYWQWFFFEEPDTIQFQNLVIKDNYASQQGGGIYLNGEQYDSLSCISIRDLVVQNNEAHGNDSDYAAGGGIYCENLNLKMENITIKGNTGNLYGGGAYFLNSNSVLQNCVISENIAISPMHPGAGGGLSIEYSTLLIQNTMINDNIPEGIYCWYSNTIITNSIFWDHDEHHQIMLSNNSTATISYSDIQYGENGIELSGINATINWLDGNINEDPLFEGSGDHPYQLSASSPCIDAGIPDATGLNLPDGDIMGNERIWDGDNNGSVIIDIGCYEFGSFPVGIEKPIVRDSNLNIQCYPNPVSENCILEFELTQTEQVTIQVFNSVGKLIDEPGNRVLQPGPNQLIINMESLPEGIYLVHLQLGNKKVTKKIVKVK